MRLPDRMRLDAGPRRWDPLPNRVLEPVIVTGGKESLGGQKRLLGGLVGRSIATSVPGTKALELFTDHQALKRLVDFTDASSRLARWCLRLFIFDFVVRDKKGAKNQIADAISRLPTYAPTTETEDDLEIPSFALLEGCACARRPYRRYLVDEPRCGGGFSRIRRLKLHRGSRRDLTCLYRKHAP